MATAVIFAPVLVFVALATVLDDARTGLIRNRRLLHGLAAAAVAYLAAAAVGCLAGEGGGWAECLRRGGGWALSSALNAACGLVAGAVLWHLGVWAAGDAKLFALYCLLIPVDRYGAGAVPVFPAIALLVNVFAVTFLYLAADLLAGARPAARELAAWVETNGAGGAARRAVAALAGALPILLTFMALFAGIRAIRETVRGALAPLLHVSELTLFLLLFALARPLSAAVRGRAGWIAFALLSSAALAWLVAREGAGPAAGLLRPGLSSLLIVLFARLYRRRGDVARRVTVGALRPGMILAPRSVAALRGVEERERAAGGEAAEEEDEGPGTTLRPRRLGPMTADGLTAEQVRYVRTRFDDDEGVLVSRTVRFSPLLAAGALFTFLAGKVFLAVARDIARLAGMSAGWLN